MTPLRRDSGYTDTSGPRAAHAESDEEEDTVSFTPKLSQIQEGKASAHSRSRVSSTVGSATGSQTRRRRYTEDDTMGRSRARPKHAKSQQRAESLAKLSNPSLISDNSGVTQQSTTSGESNSTVTKQSYDEDNQFNNYESPRDRRKLQKQRKASHSDMSAEMDAAPSNVFQFLSTDSRSNSSVNDDVQHAAPSTAASTSSSSGEDGTVDDERSSFTVEFPHDTDSSMTSPASTRTSNTDAFQHQGRDYRNKSRPLYASSFVHGHGDEEHEDDDDDVDDNDHDDDDDDDEEETESDEGSESESDEEHQASFTDVADEDDTPNQALEKVPPPRVPSTSSRHSDPHSRRLRQQERELANHILQSPQPQKDIQFGAASAAGGYLPMPLYSPRAYSDASPAASHAAAAPVPAWPHVPPMPAPLPIAYSPHQSPEARHAYPLPVQPPEQAVQHRPPPFPQHAMQPPLYQQHAPGPDLSRTTVMGYELLAEKLSEPSLGSGKRPRKGGIVPMYRKFEHLNHRVLLHLQDEICELEEELRYLDEAIAQTLPRDESGHAYPASRRGDARFGGDLHYRRTDLLGRIFQKLGQYSEYITLL